MKPLVSFGQFVYGETGADLIVRLKKEDGTVIDVTSATSITLRWRTHDGQSGTIAGTVVSPGTAGQLRFEDPGNALDPGTRPSLSIDFIVRCTISTEVFNSRQIGRFEIQRWP